MKEASISLKEGEMKIYCITHKGVSSQEIPFTMGEDGRGRKWETVSVDHRNPPVGPGEVGYELFGEHAVLTAARSDQTGVMLRIDTRGTYTRGSGGNVKLVAGPAQLLAKGWYADGQAGGINKHDDELWHVSGPAVFLVYFAGGFEKGYGNRYLVVTRRFTVAMSKPDELANLIATDADPNMADTIRLYADQMSEKLQTALKTAEKLEAAAEAPATQVNHFYMEWLKPGDAAANLGITIPPAMGGKVTGVSGLEAGALVPGDKPLLVISIGPGGGNRYGFKVVRENDLTRLKDETNRKGTSTTIITMVESEGWQLAWINLRDREIESYNLADTGGVHCLYPDEKELHTESWVGRKSIQPEMTEFRKVFGI